MVRQALYRGYQGLLVQRLGIPACKAVQRARRRPEYSRPPRLFHARNGIASDVCAGSS